MIATRSLRKSPGFTIMEILVVLATVGILGAIALPFYRDYMIRAEVMGSFDFAESMRAKVMLDDAEGRLKEGLIYPASGSGRTEPLATLGWTPGKPGTGLKGRMTAGLYLPRIGESEVAGFVLEWRESGDWHCVSAAKYPDPRQSPLDAKYLPAACREGSGPMARPTGGSAAAPTCPADQELVTLSTGPACTPKCAPGQTRDSANPANCKPLVCGANEMKHPNTGACINIGSQPDCGPTGDPHIAYSSDNTPGWSCFPKCAPGQIRAPNNWFSCIPDPNAKPPAAAVAMPTASAVPAAPAAAAAAAAAAKPAAASTSAPAANQPSVKCHVCDPSVPELCELVSVETTCTYPNNWCVTVINNNADSTKGVTRRCGNFEKDARLEWWHGSSDNDKCRERIDVEQYVDFTCTFACNKDNCNQSGRSLRPEEDSLYKDQ